MPALLIGYARVSTDAEDLTAQRDGLHALGVDASRIYVDHGLSGTNRDRPSLREAIAACREGDTLVVTKLDRLARPLPDARAILEELTVRHGRLSLGGSVHDPADPVGRLLFTVLAMIAEFEADLIRMRTREGMKVARAKGRLGGRQPKLTSKQEAHLAVLVANGQNSTLEVAELFGVARSSVYRAMHRAGAQASATARGNAMTPRHDGQTRSVSPSAAVSHATPLWDGRAPPPGACPNRLVMAIKGSLAGRTRRHGSRLSSVPVRAQQSAGLRDDSAPPVQ